MSSTFSTATSLAVSAPTSVAVRAVPVARRGDGDRGRVGDDVGVGQDVAALEHDAGAGTLALLDERTLAHLHLGVDGHDRRLQRLHEARRCSFPGREADRLDVGARGADVPWYWAPAASEPATGAVPPSAISGRRAEQCALVRRRR